MGYAEEQLARENAFVESDRFTQRRYRLFARSLGADFCGTVLDVGCGLGLGGSAFRESAPGATLDGNELVPHRIERMPPGVYRKIFPGLIQDVPKQNLYDVILAGEVIEHVPFTELDNFLGAIHARLTPGGKLLLTTPNPHYFLLRQRSSGSVLGGAHVSVHCRATLGQYLAASGFRVWDVRGSGKVSSLLGTKAPQWLYGAFYMAATKL